MEMVTATVARPVIPGLAWRSTDHLSVTKHGVMCTVDCCVELAITVSADRVGVISRLPGDRDNLWDWHQERLAPGQLAAGRGRSGGGVSGPPVVKAGEA